MAGDAAGRTDHAARRAGAEVNFIGKIGNPDCGGLTLLVSSDEPFEPVQHEVEPPKPAKKCKYRHVSSTASLNPPCLPNCPAGDPAFKANPCTVLADCPFFKVKSKVCATQGRCLEVYAVVDCVAC